MSFQNPRNQSISYLILNGGPFHHSRSDEELVLDVYKVLTQLNGFNVRVLDRVLDFADTHRPRTGRTTNLHFASSRDSLLLQLLNSKVWGGNQERHLDSVILGAK